MQALFQLDAQGDGFLGELGEFFSDSSNDSGVIERAEHLTRGAWADKARIDEWIAQASEHWSIGRMAPVDRSILRLAVFEMTGQGATPVVVAIDEAIEIAKEFGEAESPQFINGLLDAVHRRLSAAGSPTGTADAQSR
jgi:N utilization substance protein B